MKYTTVDKLHIGKGRLRCQLLGIILGLVALCVSGAVAALIAVIWNNSHLNRVQEQTSQRALLAAKWQAEVRVNNDAAIASIMNTNAVTQGILDQRMKASLETKSRLLDQLAQGLSDPREREAMDSLRSQGEKITALIAQLRQTRQGGELALAVLGVSRDLRPLVDAQLQGLDAYNQLLSSITGEEVYALQAQRTRILWGAICAVGTLIVLGMVLALRMSNQIAADVGMGLRAAEAIATGDLTQVMSSQRKDELAALVRSLEAMRTNLAEVVTKVRVGSKSVASASSEIAQGNQDLSERTESQASALEETAASMGELSSQVQHNAENARQANQLASNASAVAARGGEVVSRVVGTMKEINSSSRKISEITSVIDGIAFQTNILALNAAVEAARAGEQGRGFAVVANEVRSLAGRCAEAAKEIKSLINASVNRVEQGTALVDEAGTTMTEIVDSIRKVNDLVSRISAASDVQAAGVTHVGQAVTKMDQATQQNAALVEQMAAAANSLRAEAGELVQTVAIFKLGADDGILTPTAHSNSPVNTPFKSAERRSIAATPVPSFPKAPKPSIKNSVSLPRSTTAEGGSDKWETF